MNQFRRQLNAIKNRYQNRLTARGRFFFILMLVSLIFGLNPSKSMLYQVVSLCFAILVIGGLFTLRFSHRLTIKRSLPDNVMSGRSFAYDLTIINDSNKRIQGIAFRDSGDLDIADCHVSELCNLNRNENVSVKSVITVKKRGYCLLDGIWILQEDPLGIMRKPRFYPIQDKILVLPKLYSIPNIQFQVHRRFHQGGIPFAEKKGETEEFISLREYRSGDPIKKINWKASAKSGKTIVNEYQDEYHSRYGLVLDTYVDKASRRQFEIAVSLSASIVFSSDLHESVLDLMFLGSVPYRIPIGSGLNSRQYALSVIAGVQGQPRENITELAQLIKQHLFLMHSMILVLLRLDEERIDIIRSLVSNQIHLKILLVAEKPEKEIARINSLNLKADITVISRKDPERSIHRITDS